MDKPDNPSAFPVNAANLGGPGAYPPDPGMSLRDWFAGQALPVVIVDLAQDRNETDPNDMPRLSAIGAYLYADAMLAERERG